MTSPVRLPEFSELTLLLDYLEAPRGSGVLVDVGAHVGSVSKAFARKGWRTVAFEPAEDNYKELEAAMSEFPDSLLIPKAVSDETKDDVTFYRSTEHWGIHSLVGFHSTHTDVTTVDTVRIEDVLDGAGITDIDVLKIDIEGADFLALKSLNLERFRPRIVMTEFADDRSQLIGYTHHDVVRHMADHGYAAWVSEWAPIVSFGRRGVPGTAHTFLRCCPYPVRHQPAWGNLIFVPDNDASAFDGAVVTYLAKLTAMTRETVAELHETIRLEGERARKLLASVEDQAVRLATFETSSSTTIPATSSPHGGRTADAAKSGKGGRKAKRGRTMNSRDRAWMRIERRTSRLEAQFARSSKNREQRLAKLERRLKRLEKRAAAARRRPLWKRAVRKLLSR